METDRQAIPNTQNFEESLPDSAERTPSAALDQVGMGFRVGGMGLLIATHSHCELVERPQVSPLPNVSAWLGGLLNLHGNVVPVIDLRLLLGQTAGNPHKSSLFAVGKGEKTIAFWIDGYPEMLSGFSPSLEPLPALPELLRHCALATVQHNGQQWLNIDPNELFKAIGRKNPQRTTEETAP
jgi:twitching motility protein PilI